MQQGGSQYGVPPPEMTSFATSGTGTRAQVLGISGSEHQLAGAAQQHQLQQAPLAEAASPISSRPPPRGSNFDELASAVSGGFTDEDALAAAAGEEAERGAVSGNRWPRQETLALLKIRSDMDATFRDATLKGPLWEDVSRKLGEMGYKRSGKKCKEKFENVHKYYKRTKDGRAGRQDGKTYRFFSQLEALHSSGTATTLVAAPAISAPAPAATDNTPGLQPSIGMLGSTSGGRLQPTPLNMTPPPMGTAATRLAPDTMAGTSAGLSGGPTVGVSFSSDTASSSASESEGEDTEEGLPGESRKRKRRSGGDSGSRKMMAFFEGLMKQVMERQEAMQQRFLETIEKREQDRMIREEAWKRQEMARLNREHEMMAQERAISASRDSAIVAFLQKVTGQTVPMPTTVPAATPPPPPVPQPPPKQQQPSTPAASVTVPPPTQQPQPPRHVPPPQPQTKPPIHYQGNEIVCAQAPCLEVGPAAEAPEVVGASGPAGTTDPTSSRWPKTEVHALISIRSGLESRYQEAGPKGPLWEEISAEMLRLGYNRSAKRCKEKWENINKYFKKVKESNKKRHEDSKTCPYFHQLDALYRKKVLGSGGGAAGSSQAQEDPETDANPPLLPAPPQQTTVESEGKKNDGGSSNNGNRNSGNREGNGGPAIQIPSSNGGFAASFFGREEAGGGVPLKKPEDIVKELMDHHHQQQHPAGMDAYRSLGDPDSDDMDEEEDEEDDEDDEDSKMEYKIQYQQSAGVNGTSNGGGNQSAASAAAAAGGSFMAMVQ